VEDLLGVIDRNHKVRSAVSEKTSSRQSVNRGAAALQRARRKLLFCRGCLPSV
jgi:hypothetical protein